MTAVDKILVTVAEEDTVQCSSCHSWRHYDEYAGKRVGRYKTCLTCRTRSKANNHKNKCDHGTRKERCKECGGSAFCDHGKRKDRCIECGGSAFCDHGKRKERCKECGGSAFCEHGKRKDRCKECGGSAFCEHGKRKDRCKECGGSGICDHGKRKERCKECGGSAFCEHGKQKYTCKECSPISHLHGIVLCRIRTVLPTLENPSKHIEELLGIPIEEYREYLEGTFEEGMSWDNYGKELDMWQIDHTLPLNPSKNAIEEIMQRLHFENTRAMWCVENWAKGYKEPELVKESEDIDIIIL